MPLTKRVHDQPCQCGWLDFSELDIYLLLVYIVFRLRRSYTPGWRIASRLFFLLWATSLRSAYLAPLYHDLEEKR